MKTLIIKLVGTCRSFTFCLLILMATFICSPVLSQVGIGTTSPDASAVLDIVSSDKGILVPRVALVSKDNASPISSPTTSLMVYNTASAGTGSNAVSPGFYYWNGTEWIPLSESAIIETPQNATLSGSWTSVSGFGDLKYYKDRGRVYLSGRVMGGTGIICNLPSGYRPIHDEIYRNYNGDIIVIETNGDIRYNGGANNAVFSGFSFKSN